MNNDSAVGFMFANIAEMDTQFKTDADKLNKQFNYDLSKTALYLNL